MPDYQQEVFEAAQGILGELTSCQTQFLSLITEAVCQQMSRRLKKGTSLIVCRSAFISACALHSVVYLRSADKEELSSFTAGTVSLSFEQNSSSLSRLADELMAPWLDTPSVFRGVRS